MKCSIVVRAPQGAGKTRWLDQVKAALLGSAPAEAVEVTMFEGPSRGDAPMHDEFTVPAGPRVASGTASGGDRETWSMEKGTAAGWQVLNGSRWRAHFYDREHAELFMAVATMTPERRKALDAILRGDLFHYTGDRPLFSGGFVSPDCKGGRGDFAEGAGVIPRPPRVFPIREHAFRDPPWGGFTGKLSAAEAPAIHDCYPDRHRALRDAARALYDAGCWQIIGATGLKHSEQERLWTALRGALDLPPGTATAAGNAPEKSADPLIDKIACGLRQVIGDMEGWANDEKRTVADEDAGFTLEAMAQYADRLRGYAAELAPEKSAGRKPASIGRAFNEVLKDLEGERADHDFTLTQLGAAWDMLIVLAELLEGYAEHHDAEGTPESDVKAARNRRYARLARAIVHPLPEPEAETQAEAA